MNKEQVAAYCERYLDATGCHIMERSSAHLTVKLSPEADLDLTGRHYYWSFIERTGAEPETMSMKFLFDPANPEDPAAPGETSPPVRNAMMPLFAAPSNRILEETVVFGSRRLEQIFHSAHSKGRYVQLFEEPPELTAGTYSSVPYTTWLGVNYKIEFICDMKREEMISLGISMNTGEVVTDFEERVRVRKLTSRIPPRTMLRESITLARAVMTLESYIEQQLRQADYEWASKALERMEEEMARIDSYYGAALKEKLERIVDSGQRDASSEVEPMSEAATEAARRRDELTAEYTRRKEEIEWQYKPRVEVAPIHCGYYHLLSDSFRYQ